MCYDIALTVGLPTIQDYLPSAEIAAQYSFEPTWHKIGMAYPKWPVIINQDNALQIKPFTWGPIPRLLNTVEKVKKQRQFYLNARTEKFLESGTLWNAIRHQRILIPVTGFFEYREIPTWKNKVPYFIKSKDQEVFFILGLWALSPSWDVDQPDKIPTFTLGTREANLLMREIHNGGDHAGRMPMIVNQDLAIRWLDPNLTDQEMKEILNYSIPSTQLDYWSVNSVRKRHEDNEGVIAKVEYKDLPTINY